MMQWLVACLFWLARVVVGLLLVTSPWVGHKALGCVSLIEAFYGGWNLFFAGRQYDRSALGWLIPGWYLLCVVLVPERLPLTPLAENFLAVVLWVWTASVAFTVAWLGRAYTVGSTTSTGRVIGSGPYAYCRHPLLFLSILSRVMYFVACPSQWNLVVCVVVGLGHTMVTIVEEIHLCKVLPGYDAYRERVRSRFIPGLWRRPVFVEWDETDTELESAGGMQVDCKQQPGQHLQSDGNSDAVLLPMHSDGFAWVKDGFDKSGPTIGDDLDFEGVKLTENGSSPLRS